jgi:hypothetical protein
MTRRVSIPRVALPIVALLAAAALIAGVLALQPRTDPSAGLTAERAPATAAPEDADAETDADADADAGNDGDELNEEAEEQAELIGRKREALDRLVASGAVIGQQRPAGDAPAPGWAGEQPYEATAPDDWEPAVAADPSAPWVYMLVTRYGVTKPCNGNCPTPYIALRVSSDGGATFGATTPLCACKGSGQFDPIIEVVPATGHVYAVYMNGFNILFTKSTDHGTTWSAPKPVYGKVSWNDKPVLATSDDGKDVYITFNGPTGGDPWIAQSHDSGGAWAQAKLVDSNRYFFAFDADVAADGTVYLAQSSLLYGGGGNKGTYPTAAIEEHVFVSTNKGGTWTDRTVASVEAGLACSSGGCTPDYWLGHTALSVDGTGRVVLAYDGATTRGGLQTITTRRSTDKGATWSSPVTLSVSGEEATAPAMEATGSGDIRAWYQQTSGGGNVDQWNTWYRRSTDGGTTWSTAVRLSDATGGAAYKTAAGYLETYGDYGELAITSTGKSFAVWGEGASYDGPGGVWYNREP